MRTDSGATNNVVVRTTIKRHNIVNLYFAVKSSLCREKLTMLCYCLCPVFFVFCTAVSVVVDYIKTYKTTDVSLLISENRPSLTLPLIKHI